MGFGLREDETYALLNSKIKESWHGGATPEQVKQINKNTQDIEEIKENGITVDDIPSYSDVFDLLSEEDV